MLVVRESHHPRGHVLQGDVADVVTPVEVGQACGQDEDTSAERDSLQALLDGGTALPVRGRRRRCPIVLVGHSYAGFPISAAAAADSQVKRSQIAIAAVTQRPITASALADPATVNPPASVPKWEIVALEDHAIPTQAEQFMASRAHAHVVSTHSGHDVPAARPGVVDSTIVQAAQSAG